MSTLLDPILSPYQLGPLQFPGYWQYLLPPEILNYRIPTERRASCAACPMIESRGFRPDYRCCTYLPFVPGFAIGLAMLEGKRKTQLERLVDSGYMTPEGLHPSPLARFHAKREDALGLYGKGESLCHLLEPETGYCGIYAFRNGVCSTFFCVHDHGLVGEEFWSALRDLVCQLETGLQQWALRQLDFDLDAYMLRLDELATDPLNASLPTTRAWRPELLEELWGDWRERKCELFLECANLVSKHRENLFFLAERQAIVEPAVLEAVLQTLTSNDSKALDQVTVRGNSPIANHLDLVRDIHKVMWMLPEADALLRLNPKVTLDRSTGILRFDEEDDYWELNVTAAEVNCLLYFSVPRSMNKARRECREIGNLADFNSFIAEYLASHVLEQI